MKYFKYGAKEIEHLKKRDKKLAKIIEKRGIIKREMTEDPFAALIESIIGQQISGRAAQAVTARFYKLLNGDISPVVNYRVNSLIVHYLGSSVGEIPTSFKN